MLALIAIGVSLGASIVSFAGSRRFVRERLRYVDAVHRASAPFIAGTAAAVVAAPVVAVLPLVGLGTAISVGLSVGMGVAAGARDVKG